MKNYLICVVAIYLFLMGFFIGSFKREAQEEIKVGPTKQQYYRVPNNFYQIEMENNSKLVLCPLDGKSGQKVIVSREAQFRVYAEDGTYTLVGLEDWLNNTDVGMEFSSNWMVER